MKKNLLFLAIAGQLLSCQENAKNLNEKIIHYEKSLMNIGSGKIPQRADSFHTEKKITTKNEISTPYLGGAQWLKKSIENKLNIDRGTLENLCTKQYAEFKNDATRVGYEGGLTKREFKRKWQGKYNVDLVTKENFLFGMQDYGKIEVTSIMPKNIENNGAWYNVTIKDIRFNNTVHRKIRIVKNGQRFLIDEVLVKG